MNTNKQLEIFCGTGGVGKTTLAASRAFYLAQIGKKVLLVTIDPAKRLKEVLKLNEDEAGTISTVDTSTLSDKFKDWDNVKLDVLLMSPKVIISKLFGELATKNHIIEILSRPHGGMNEIMSIIQVQMLLEEGKYDCIVLDTPPGKHFIDFLDSAEKIRKFFDKSFLDIFKYLGKTVSKNFHEKSSGIFSMVVSSGIKKLLSYLENVTGKQFVDEFIDAVITILDKREHFIKALSFQSELKKQSFSNWFLVTATNHQKLTETNDILIHAKDFMHEDSYLCINKSLLKELKAWDPKSNPIHVQLKNDMISREEKILNFATNSFRKNLTFPEVLEVAPENQVLELVSCWKDFK